MTSASYRKAFVNVVEIPSRAIASRAGQPDPDVAAWFRRSPDYGWARRRPDGVALDVEAYVDEYRAALAGEETRGHVYADLRPARRDVATALLLDASSSLNAAGGRSMRLQLECADALTEALSQAGEPYAAFAFTGSTRHHVAVEVLRDFADEGFVRPTETALQPDGYTRLGAALRHVTARLLDVAAERRILIALGDGLPSDEGYEGPYAIHDVAKAIEEATAEGVIAFYVGVGRVRRDRLHDALGDYSMERVNDVAELPTVLATIYERLRRQ
jgi:nitric oxide reductase activation protein